MDRISEKQLHSVINTLNEVTGSPAEYRGENGTNIGHFCLDVAYGGYSLNRLSNTQGGVTTRYCYGRHTKRELYDLIHAMIQGVLLGKGDPNA